MPIARSLLLSGLILLIMSMSILGQSVLDELSVDLNGLTKSEAIRLLAERSGIPILFSDSFFDQNPIEGGVYNKTSLQLILEDLLGAQISIEEQFDPPMLVLSQAFYTVFGYVRDAHSGEALPYSNILINGHHVVGADKNGRYFVKLKAGQNQLQASYITYADSLQVVSINNNRQVDLQLRANNRLPELVITESNALEAIRDINKYSYKDLMVYSAKTPGISGSDDIFHAARAIPGVQSGGAGIGGHFVRGGNQGQNQYLLDDVPIYNPFHAMGLVSVLSPEIARSFRLHKIGYGAEHGDFSSSVFDIRLREGNLQKIEGGARLNPNDLAVHLGIPILKDKLSVFAYGRKSIGNYNFEEVLQEALFPDAKVELDNHYGDVLAKLKWNINTRNSIALSYFRSSDELSGQGEDEEDEEQEFEANLNWGNELLSLQWQSILDPALFLNAHLSTNSYISSSAILSTRNEIEEFYFSYLESNNRDYMAKVELDYLWMPWLRLNSGLGFVHQTYKPIDSYFDEDSFEFEDDEEEAEFEDDFDLEFLRSLSEIPEDDSQKIFAFSEAHMDFEHWKIKAGLRFTQFRHQNFQQAHLQPRLSLDYRLADRQFLGLTYTRSIQYNHLVGNSAISLPQDFWYPSDEELPPQLGHQLDLGYTYYRKRHHNFRANLYAKKVANVAQLIIPENIATGDIEEAPVESRAYGLELEYNLTKTSYGLKAGYTLSKSDIHYQGKSKAFQFDRRHEFKSLFYWDVHKNFSLGSNIYLASGHPKLVSLEFDLQSGILPEPSSQTRSGWQYRLDFSMEGHWSIRSTEHRIKLNFFNTFDSQLALYYSTEEDSDELTPQFNLGFMPSLSYSVNF